MRNLKSCLFCYSDKVTCENIDIEDPDDDDEELQDFYFVLCAECSAQGPLKPTPAQAEKAWNRPARKIRKG